MRHGRPAISLLAFCFGVLAAHPAPTQEGPAPGPEAMPNQGYATRPAASTYANVIFGRALQARCGHLEGAEAAGLAANAGRIEAYMETVFPPETTAGMKADAEAAAADAEAHPCGEETRAYLERLAPYAGEVSETIARLQED